MRQIKFRAWDRHNKKMLDRVLAGCNKDDSSYVCNLVWHEESKDWTNFDEGCGVIMQFTGLTDRNGKEIYEGDILRCSDDADEILELNSDTGIGVVEWIVDGFWNVSKIENWLGNLRINGYVEVIGNIYENPELLERNETNATQKPLL